MQYRSRTIALIFLFVIITVFMGGAIAEGLTARFLDVGQADAAILTCDGEVLMIDGGNAGDSDFRRQ